MPKKMTDKEMDKALKLHQSTLKKLPAEKKLKATQKNLKKFNEDVKKVVKSTKKDEEV